MSKNRITHNFKIVVPAGASFGEVKLQHGITTEDGKPLRPVLAVTRTKEIIERACEERKAPDKIYLESYSPADIIRNNAERILKAVPIFSDPEDGTMIVRLNIKNQTATDWEFNYILTVMGIEQ